MFKNIQTYIHNKYYLYVPGEFLPVYSGSQMINKKSFHWYKTKRALWRIQRRLSYALQTAKA